MSGTVNDGGPAFPFGQVSEVTGAPINGYHNDGMSLRDYFAGMALQGGLASTETLQQGAMLVQQAGGKITLEQMLAIRSYAFADAMLEARKGVQP